MPAVLGLIFVMFLVALGFVVITNNEDRGPSRDYATCTRYETIRGMSDIYACKVGERTCYIYQSYGISCL